MGAAEPGVRLYSGEARRGGDSHDWEGRQQRGRLPERGKAQQRGKRNQERKRESEEEKLKEEKGNRCVWWGRKRLSVERGTEGVIETGGRGELDRSSKVRGGTGNG